MAIKSSKQTENKEGLPDVSETFFGRDEIHNQLTEELKERGDKLKLYILGHSGVGKSVLLSQILAADSSNIQIVDTPGLLSNDLSEKFSLSNRDIISKAIILLATAVRAEEQGFHLAIVDDHDVIVADVESVTKGLYGTQVGQKSLKELEEENARIKDELSRLKRQLDEINDISRKNAERKQAEM